MELQPARLKQENNVNLMYRMHLHGFCKVVTSFTTTDFSYVAMHLHGFCKVVTSDWQIKSWLFEMHLHGFCKVVTSRNTIS